MREIEMTDESRYIERLNQAIRQTETQADTVISGADVYFNWERNPDSELWPDCTGRFIGDLYDQGRAVYCGHLYVQEAIRHKLQELRQEGKFLPIWEESALFGLNHDGDKGKDGCFDKEARQRSLKRLAALPEQIQQAISFQDDYGVLYPPALSDTDEMPPANASGGVDRPEL